MYQVLSSSDTVNQAIQGMSGTQAVVVTPQETSLWWQALICQEDFPRDLVVGCAQPSHGSESNSVTLGPCTVGKGQGSHLSGDPKKIIKQIPSAKIAGDIEKRGGPAEKGRNLSATTPLSSAFRF